VLSAYRNQGYAFEAAIALVDFAFTQPQLQRIIAHCPDDHAVSIHILAKLGMQLISRDANLLKWELKLKS